MGRRKARHNRRKLQSAATVTGELAVASGNRPAVVARYDAAQTTDDNMRHFAMADGLSAAAAASPEVRRLLRNRARYEVANNSYASGMVRTLANDTIGTGPKLSIASEDTRANRIVSDLFWDWSESVGLAATLRLMRIAKCADGEAIAVKVNNLGARRPVKLDLKLYESDQLASDTMAISSLSDGILYDDYGNPLRYQFLPYHPGGDEMAKYGRKPEEYPADYVIHWYRKERPGQLRGVPEITPAIPLYAQLRRYTLAVLSAAETAADMAGILHSDAPQGVDADYVDPFDTIDIHRRMLMTLPRGWNLSQLKAEQPTTTYEMFKRAIISEIARCLNMPYNVAAGDSSSYNYSSGRLDHRTYYKSINVERSEIENRILNIIFRDWLIEASRVEKHFPERFRVGPAPVPFWNWDGDEHIDPLKEANAQRVNLEAKATTYREVYAKQNKDWEEEFEQIARERDKMKSLGLSVEDVSPSRGRVPDGSEDDDDA